MTFYRRLRLMYGLRWQRKHPPIPFRQLLLAALCLVTYGAVARVGDLEHKAMKMERLAQSNGVYAQTFFECMSAGANKEIGGFYLPDSGKAFECSIKEL